MGKRLNSSIKLIAFFSVFVFVLGFGTCLTSFDSHARDYDFYLSYAEPSTGDYTGYINVLLQSTSTGEFVTETYFWYCAASVNGSLSPCYAMITLDDTKLVYSIGGNSSSANPFYSLSSMSSTGRFGYITSSQSSSYTVDFSRWGWRVMAYKYSGNVGSISVSNVSNDINLYSIYFSEDGSSVLLRDIYEQLQSLRQGYGLGDLVVNLELLNNSIDNIELDLDYMRTCLDSIRDYVDIISSDLSLVKEKLDLIYDKLYSIEFKLDSLIDEQQTSNSWLGKIWHAIVDFFTPNQDDEDKKNELDDEYQSQVDDLEDLDEGLELDKPPPEEVEEEIEDNLDVVEDEDEEDLEEFKDILSLILNNEYIIEMLLIVLTLILIAFVFYGKR